MKTTKDFTYYLENFFLKYLTCEIGASKHTIRAYRDTFVLLIEFINKKYNVINLSYSYSFIISFLKQ